VEIMIFLGFLNCLVTSNRTHFTFLYLT